MKITRRKLFGLLAAAVVGAKAAPPVVEWAMNTTGLEPFGGTYGGIDRATFKFWRNQQVTAGADALSLDALREIYNQCSK